MSREGSQQGELLGRQFHALGAAFYNAVDRVQYDVAGPNDSFHGLPARASRERSYAGEQLGESERFGKVVVGPGIEAIHPVLDLTPIGEHQYRYAHLRRVEPADDLDPIEIGEHPVHDQQVEQFR